MIFSKIIIQWTWFTVRLQALVISFQMKCQSYLYKAFKRFNRNFSLGGYLNFYPSWYPYQTTSTSKSMYQRPCRQDKRWELFVVNIIHVCVTIVKFGNYVKGDHYKVTCQIRNSRYLTRYYGFDTLLLIARGYLTVSYIDT